MLEQTNQGGAIALHLGEPPMEPPAFSRRLREEKARLEARLDQVNDALDCMDTNPEAARLVDAISKLGGLF